MFLQGPAYVPPGAVEGVLQSIDGTPAIAARVVAYKVPGSGNPDDNLNYFDLERPVLSTQTDNDGHFIMQDLPPGNYYIMAGTAGQGTYYPGVRDLKSAAKISIVSGQLVDGLDMKLLFKNGGKVAGRVNADMALLGPRSVTITGPPLEDLVVVPVSPDGSFRLPELPQGNLFATIYPPTSGMPLVKIKVTDTDISGFELTPLPTQNVTGRIVVDGADAAPASIARPWIVTLSPIPSAPPLIRYPPIVAGRVDSSGQFAIRNVTPGRYMVRLDGAPTDTAAILGVYAADRVFINGEVEISAGSTIDNLVVRVRR